MVKVANYMFVNVYLPYKDTTDRLITEAMLYSSSVNATRNRVCSPVSIDCLRPSLTHRCPSREAFFECPLLSRQHAQQTIIFHIEEIPWRIQSASSPKQSLSERTYWLQSFQYLKVKAVVISK